jgi:hypothetical protein
MIVHLIGEDKMPIPVFLEHKANHIIYGSIICASIACALSVFSMLFFPNMLSSKHLLIPMFGGLGIAGIYAISEFIRDGNDKDALAIILGASIPAMPLFISVIPYLART